MCLGDQLVEVDNVDTSKMLAAEIEAEFYRCVCPVVVVVATVFVAVGGAVQGWVSAGCDGLLAWFACQHDVAANVSVSVSRHRDATTRHLQLSGV